MTITETANKPERLTFDINEVVALTGVCKHTLYDLARQKKLPGQINLGKRVLVSKKAFLKAMDEGWTPQ